MENVLNSSDMPLIEEIEPSVELTAVAMPQSLAKKPECKRTKLLDLADVDLSIRGCPGDQQENDSESFLTKDRSMEGSTGPNVEDCNAFSIFGCTQPKAQRKTLIEELDMIECDSASTEGTKRSVETSEDDGYFQSSKTTNVSKFPESGVTTKSTSSLIIKDITRGATEVSETRHTLGEPDQTGSNSNQGTIETGSNVELYGAKTSQESVGHYTENKVKNQKREVKPRRQLTEEDLKKYPRLV